MLWIKDCRHFQNWNKSGSCTLIWKARNLNMIILLLWMSYSPSYSLHQIEVCFSKLITMTIMYFAFCNVRYTVYWTSVEFHEEHHICTVNLTYILHQTLYTIALGCCLIWYDKLWKMWSVFTTRMYRWLWCGQPGLLWDVLVIFEFLYRALASILISMEAISECQNHGNKIKCRLVY
jgi:hypothetical protein